MPFLGLISACLLLLLALGCLERVWRDRAWKAVTTRIHVNGTRGKSTVTRLIWAALRAAGMPALAKTTGAAPCLLLPDGTERRIRRWGKPNIREQLRTLWLAQRTGAKAIVLECMALAPDLQWTAEHGMTQATIGVITNARTDHTEVMGRNLAEIAASLASTVPRNAVLVVGDPHLATTCEACAAARGTKVVIASGAPEPDAALQRPWMEENIAIALTVTRQLGIPDAVALPAMRGILADIRTDGSIHCGGVRMDYFDARKANDPESFLQVWEAFRTTRAGSAEGQELLIYNHRSDRPHRLLNFAGAFARVNSPVLITGQRPAWTLWRSLRKRPGLPPVSFVPLNRLGGVLRLCAGSGRSATAAESAALQTLSRNAGASEVAPASGVRRIPPLFETANTNRMAEHAGACAALVFCGNIQGLDLPGLLRQIQT